MTIRVSLVKSPYKKRYARYAKVKAEKEAEIQKYREKIKGLEAEIDAARVKVDNGSRCSLCTSDAVVVKGYGPTSPFYQCKVCGDDGSDY